MWTILVPAVHMFVDAAPSVCRLVFLPFDGALHFLNWGLWAKRHYREKAFPSNEFWIILRLVDAKY